MEMNNPVSAFGIKLVPGDAVSGRAVLTQPMFNVRAKTYSGAAYNNLGAIIPASVRPGGLVPMRPVDSVSVSQRDYSTALHMPVGIYAGHMFYAWGHFLIETLSTAFSAPHLPLAPVLFLPWGRNVDDEKARAFIQHVRPVLAAAWGEREIIVSFEARRFDTLYVPHRLTTYGTEDPQISPRLIDVFDRIRATIAAPNKRGTRRVLFTRDPQHSRFLPYEPAVYARLEEMGFTAFRPDQMSAEDQVRLMTETDVLCGFGGSILHNSVFMPRGSTVIELGGPEEKPNRAQHNLCSIWGQPLHHLSVSDDLKSLAKIRPALATGWPIISSAVQALVPSPSSPDH